MRGVSERFACRVAGQHRATLASMVIHSSSTGTVLWSFGKSPIASSSYAPTLHAKPKFLVSTVGLGSMFRVTLPLAPASIGDVVPGAAVA